MNAKHHVKIVLPCCNEGEWLRLTVDSILERTSYPAFEIFILANGDWNTDFSFLRKSAYRKKVRFKRVAEALGVGNSINRAVWPGDAVHYVFLDAHCLITDQDWLEKAMRCLEEHPRASMVQPEVLGFAYPKGIPPGGDLEVSLVEEKDFAYSIRWAWPYRDLSEISEVQAHRRSNAAYQAMAGGGMAVFARAATFHRLGGYDPEVSGWYPETMDYCVRAWMLGHPMLVEPRIRILHRLKTEGCGYERSYLDVVHGILRTAYKYLAPRRRDLAETLFRKHGLEREVRQARDRINRGRWLEERAVHQRDRTHDDDWLFSKFQVHEERSGW